MKKKQPADLTMRNARHYNREIAALKLSLRVAHEAIRRIGARAARVELRLDRVFEVLVDRVEKSGR